LALPRFLGRELLPPNERPLVAPNLPRRAREEYAVYPDIKKNPYRLFITWIAAMKTQVKLKNDPDS
jgi:hypothetical protein